MYDLHTFLAMQKCGYLAICSLRYSHAKLGHSVLSPAARTPAK
jgi:hypothetical protein